MSAAPHEGEARPSSAVDAAGVQRLVDWFLDCNPDPGTPAAMAQALAKALSAERARADGLARERDAERTRADEWRDKHAHLDRSRESEVASLYKTIATAEASLAANTKYFQAPTDNAPTDDAKSSGRGGCAPEKDHRNRVGRGDRTSG